MEYEPVSITAGFNIGNYYEFSDINEPEFVIETESDNLYPEISEKKKYGKVIRKTKQVKLIVSGDNLEKSTTYIDGLIDNIKSFSKFNTGIKEKNMLISLIKSFKLNSLKIKEKYILQRGDKQEYYKELDRWRDNYSSSGMVTMRITKNTKYYLGNKNKEVKAIGTGEEGIWKFPVKCLIAFKISAFSGYTPVPYFKISHIIFFEISNNINGIKFAPDDYILSYNKYESIFNIFFDYIKRNNISEEKSKSILFSFVNDLPDNTNIQKSKKISYNYNNKEDNLDSDIEDDSKTLNEEDNLDSIDEEDDDINNMWIDKENIITELENKKQELDIKKEKLKDFNN